MRKVVGYISQAKEENGMGEDPVSSSLLVNTFCDLSRFLGRKINQCVDDLSGIGDRSSRKVHHQLRRRVGYTKGGTLEGEVRKARHAYSARRRRRSHRNNKNSRVEII